MREIIYVSNIILKEKELLLQVPSSGSLSNAKAGGRMLVDSDRLAFIYLLEKNDQYIYIGIQDQFWPRLREVIISNIPVFIMVQSEKLELTDFHAELNYLIENIKGNGNYGEEMVRKVEEIF